MTSRNQQYACFDDAQNFTYSARIIVAIDGIQMAVAGKTFAEFQKDWLLRHGAQRAIEIISEASRHVPDQLKNMHPNIRWRSIAGIGNVLRHEYHAISDKVIWKVIKDELPPLKAAVSTMKTAIKD
jgi:uncharacterized protein with HEPN domain